MVNATRNCVGILTYRRVDVELVLHCNAIENIEIVGWGIHMRIVFERILGVVVLTVGF